MFHLNNFKKQVNDDHCIVECQINKEIYFYQFNKDYSDYVEDYTYDAFLVSIIQVALINKKNIVIDGNISMLLYYNIINFLLPILKFQWNSNYDVKIKCNLINTSYDNKAVGTFFSGGVDSFITFKENFLSPCDENLKLTHIFYANCGAMHNNDSYINNDKYVKDFINYENIDIKYSAINSNIKKINNLPNIKAHLYTNIGCILLFKKLLKIFHYSNTYYMADVELLKIKQNPHISNTEGIVDQYITHGSMIVYPYGIQYTRTKKTDILSEVKLTYKHLNVCNDPDYLKEKENSHLNCGKCNKCKRTLFTFDILGVLKKYKNIFNLNNYYVVKNDYKNELLKNKNEFLSKEIFTLIKTRNKDIKNI